MVVLKMVQVEPFWLAVEKERGEREREGRGGEGRKRGRRGCKKGVGLTRLKKGGGGGNTYYHFHHSRNLFSQIKVCGRFFTVSPFCPLSLPLPPPTTHILPFTTLPFSFLLNLLYLLPLPDPLASCKGSSNVNLKTFLFSFVGGELFSSRFVWWLTRIGGDALGFRVRFVVDSLLPVVEGDSLQRLTNKI